MFVYLTNVPCITIIICMYLFSRVGLNNTYSVVINTIINIYTMSCETGSDSKHKAYI